MQGSPKRVAITGAGGFVGANLAHRLLREGHDLHLMLRPGGTHWRLDGLSGDAVLHRIDLSDAAAMERCIAAIRPDWIFHLAAHGAYPFQQDAGVMVAANIVATFNLLQACVRTGFESFIHAGSSSEYGFKDHPPREDEAVDPNSYYAVTKASASMLCRHVARSHNVNIAILRLYSIYGPYEEPSRFVPQLIEAGLRGTLPPLVAPHTARDFVYTADVEDAFLRAATLRHPEPGAIYNLGTGIQTTVGDVVRLARRVMGITAEPEWGSMPGRSWDTTTWVADSTKIRTVLGWSPRYTFEEGFRRTVAWYRVRGTHPLPD